MKILLFIIIVISIYFLIYKIFKTTPKTNSNENKIDDSVPNLLKNSEHPKKFIQPESKIPNTNQFIILIKQKYLEPTYYFNLPNNPLTSGKLSEQDKIYLKYIKKNIGKWKRSVDDPTNLSVHDITPIIITKTNDEFVIKVKVKLLYFKEPIYLQLVYYVKIEKMDDFFNINQEKYRLQLVNLDTLTKKEYFMITEPESEEAPFMTMEEQMSYVSKINKMHEYE